MLKTRPRQGAPLAHWAQWPHSTPVALVALVAAGLAGGCATDRDEEYRYTPVIERGACATVIMPGESVPMGSRPSCPGGVSAIGGAVVDDRRERQTRSEPMPGTDLVRAPLVAAGAPVVAAEKAMRRATGSQASSSGSGSQSRSSSGSQASAPAPAPPLGASSPQDPQAAWERAQLEALERQIESRGPTAGTTPATMGSASARVPGASLPPGVTGATGATGAAGAAAPFVAAGVLGMSIADELSALQASTRPEPALPPEPLLEVPGSVRAQTGGVADRVADRDGDARPDHWEYHEDGMLIRELFDEDGDGHPDRTVYYDPRTGLEAHVEEDRNLDGRLDSWIDYRDGRLARQRRDSDYDGSPDHWSFYRGGVLARQEVDLNGDGFRNRIAFFEAGHLVREREDRDGDGRIDRVTHYDALERVTRRDEDRDGDGIIDTRSIYQEGRLVRREMVSDALQPIEADELTTSEWSTGEVD